MSMLRRLINRCDGNIAVEVALAAPVLLVLLAGMADVGRAVLAEGRLKSAIRAGLEYAQANSGNAAGIVAVVQTASGDAGLAVTSALVCECANGGAAECGSTCADGLTPGGYVVVSATQAFTPIFPGMNTLIDGPLQAQGSIRAK